MDNVYNLNNNNTYKADRKSNKLLYIIPIIIILIIVYLLFVRNKSIVIRAEYGEVVDGFSSKSLIIRDEKIYYSPYSGTVKLKQEEGDRIGVGFPVISIINTEEKKTLYNHESGIISYSTDSLEESLSLSKIENISVKEFDNLKRNFSFNMSGGSVTRGQPVYRIINNYRFYMILKTSAKEAKRYRYNELIFINSENVEGKMIKAYIKKKIIEKEEALLILELERYVREWSSVRWVEIDFIKNIYRGIVIPRNAVFTRPEGKGVLIKLNKKDFVFKKIKVINGNDEELVVSGLNIGDWVVINPEAINFGNGRL